VISAKKREKTALRLELFILNQEKWIRGYPRQIDGQYIFGPAGLGLILRKLQSSKPCIPHSITLNPFIRPLPTKSDEKSG
jgi:hypothetical protein